MLLGLLSDTHDNLPAIEAALRLFRERGVTQLLHAGDLTRPETLTAFGKWPVVLAQGNNDLGVGPAAQRAGIPYGEWRGSIGGRQIAVVHGHERRGLEEAVRSGQFELVVTGHSHRVREEWVGGTLVVNPGALYRAARYTCAVYETATEAVELLEVPKATAQGLS